MPTSDYLFPRRQTRREFLSRTATGAAAGLLMPPALLSTASALEAAGAADTAAASGAVRLGTGAHTYEPVPNWGQLPAGMKYGFGCGVIVDGQDRVFVTSRSSNPCVA